MPLPMKKIEVSIPQNAISVIVYGLTWDNEKKKFESFVMPTLCDSEFVEVKDAD